MMVADSAPNFNYKSVIGWPLNFPVITKEGILSWVFWVILIFTWAASDNSWKHQGLKTKETAETGGLQKKQLTGFFLRSLSRLILKHQ